MCLGVKNIIEGVVGGIISGFIVSGVIFYLNKQRENVLLYKKALSDLRLNKAGRGNAKKPFILTNIDLLRISGLLNQKLQEEFDIYFDMALKCNDDQLSQHVRPGIVQEKSKELIKELEEEIAKYWIFKRIS